MVVVVVIFWARVDVDVDDDDDDNADVGNCEKEVDEMLKEDDAVA